MRPTQYARLVVFLSVVGLAVCYALAAKANPLDEPDKRLHFDVSARIGFLFGGFVYAAPEMTQPQRLAASSALCLAPGVGKEALDAITHEADAMDLAADLAGCAVGIGAGAAVGTGLRVLVVQPIVDADGGVTVAMGWRF